MTERRSMDQESLRELSTLRRACTAAHHAPRDHGPRRSARAFAAARSSRTSGGRIGGATCSTRLCRPPTNARESRFQSRSASRDTLPNVCAPLQASNPRSTRRSHEKFVAMCPDSSSRGEVPRPRSRCTVHQSLSVFFGVARSLAPHRAAQGRILRSISPQECGACGENGPRPVPCVDAWTERLPP